MSLTSEVGSGRGFPGDDGGLAEEVKTPPGGGSSGTLPGRVERYAVAHARALEMAHYVVQVGAEKGTRWSFPFFKALATKLRECGEYLLFRHYTRLDVVRLHAAKFCQVHHLCPLCAIRRGSKLLRKYLERFALLSVEHPQAKGYFVTLTVKNGADLKERFGQLKYGLQSLQKRRHYDEARVSQTCMRGVLGGVGSFEFKRGSGSELWHAHYHGVWLSVGEIDKFKLSAEWKQITGDSFILDVRPLYGESAVDGFLECFKYAVKFSDMSLPDNYEAYRELVRSKLVRSFGVFYGIDVERLDDEGPIPEDEPYIELMYRYLAGVGYSFVPEHREAFGGAEASVVEGTPADAVPECSGAF